MCLVVIVARCSRVAVITEGVGNGGPQLLSVPFQARAVHVSGQFMTVNISINN